MRFNNQLLWICGDAGYKSLSSPLPFSSVAFTLPKCFNFFRIKRVFENVISQPQLREPLVVNSRTP